MQERILQMYRVRVYSDFGFSGTNRTMTHSFRVSADSVAEAEYKVRDFLFKSGDLVENDYPEIKARPAGKVAFYE